MGIVKRGTRSVLRSPLRLMLVVVLLGTSLMFVAAMLALSTDAQENLAEINGQLATDVTISQENFSDLSPRQIALAQHAPGVTGSAEEVYLTQGEAPGQPLQLPAVQDEVSNVYYTWWGLSPGIPLHGRAGYPAQITGGRTFTASEIDANVVLLSVSMAQANHLRVGSTLTYNGTSLTVIGLYTTGTAIGDLSVILPVQTGERVLHAGVRYLILYAGSSDQVPALVRYLHQSLGDTFNVSSHANDFAGTLNSLTGIARISQSGLLAAFIASTLIIAFTVFLALQERTQEIAILKALGASHWQVVGQFGIEVLDLSLLASLFAAFLLLFVGPLITNAAKIAPPQDTAAASALSASPIVITLTSQTLLLLLSAAIALALVASALPAWYVARLKPSQLLCVE